MRNITLALGMALVLLFSLAILAQDETKSPAQLCKEWNWGGTPAFDACVSCVAQGGYPAGKSECVCKTLQYFEPEFFEATYKNLGNCIKQLNAEKK